MCKGRDIDYLTQSPISFTHNGHIFTLKHPKDSSRLITHIPHNLPPVGTQLLPICSTSFTHILHRMKAGAEEIMGIAEFLKK